MAVPEDDGSNNQNSEQVEADYFSAELAGSHEDNSAGRFLCHHCSNSYSDRRGLKRHLDKVSGKHYQCEICFKTFSRNDVYRRHVKLVHARFYRSQGGDSFYCDLTT
ncbi:hypothetical protein EGW08_000461 [Elysia chlorotica]|uniref:C2H2-type domain-containing protein n=1 Tax=Elysia chlorotica TaxID=188477 RepID=A0A3S1A6D3_ELYCH|nr:hypothetical protein EGW08_000461 [Elysia chlorotica]